MPSISVAERSDRGARRIAERRPLVAEDAGVAVLVGADSVPDPEVGQNAREDPHRVLDSRVLRIGLDPREGGLGAGALHLELRHEHRRLAADALGIDHRPFTREEPEAGEVLDVVRTEEDVAGQAIAPDALEQRFAPLLQLGGRDAGAGLGSLFHHLLLGCPWVGLAVTKRPEPTWRRKRESVGAQGPAR